MDFNDKDFATLTYHVHEHDKNANFFKLFPIFSRFDVFTSYATPGVNRNFLMRYIVYCFDKGSPLSSINNLFERRVKAAQLAGFPCDNKNRFSEPVETMLLSKDLAANCMIIQYCIMHAGEDYTTLVFFQDTLRKQLEKLALEEDSGSAKDLIGNIQKLREDIRSTRDLVFTFTGDPWLTADLYSFMEMKRSKITPEDWASLLTESETVLDNPNAHLWEELETEKELEKD